MSPLGVFELAVFGVFFGEDDDEFKVGVHYSGVDLWGGLGFVPDDDVFDVVLICVDDLDDAFFVVA